jgi:hypothetical protein
VFGAASERIEVSEVTVGQFPVVQTDGKVDVQVRYQLAGQQYEVILVAQRDDGVLGFGRQWRVITPRTIPVSISYDRPGVGQARIGKVPGPAAKGEREGKFLHVYPGTYTISADPSAFFTAEGHTVYLAVNSDSHGPLPLREPLAYVTLQYLPNERLLRDAGKLALDRLDACLARSPELTRYECSYPTHAEAAARLSAKPTVTIPNFQHPYLREPGEITNPVRVVVEFSSSYTTESGETSSEQSILDGMVHFDEDQTLRIDHWGY